MPELPEVETIRQDLRRKILHKKIVGVEVFKEKTVDNNEASFKRGLLGNEFKEIDRRGKLLIGRLKKRSESLLIHLKMTGQLIYEIKLHGQEKIFAGGHSFRVQSFNLPDKHTQVKLTFSDKSHLFFNDLRRFGYMKLANPALVGAALKRFGIEPLTPGFIKPAFLNLLKNRSTKIKAILMNQELIAGIGNIYADEICFEAGVKPTRVASSLSVKEKEALFKACTKILKKAVKFRGTTFNNYVDSDGQKGNFTKHLMVYGRGGQICKRCKKSQIKKLKVIQRGTHWCPECQK